VLNFFHPIIYYVIHKDIFKSIFPCSHPKKKYSEIVFYASCGGFVQVVVINYCICFHFSFIALFTLSKFLFYALGMSLDSTSNCHYKNAFNLLLKVLNQHFLKVFLEEA